MNYANQASLVEPGHFGADPSNIVALLDFIEPDDVMAICSFAKANRQWDNSLESQYSEDGTCIYDASYWHDRTCSAPIIQRQNPGIYSLLQSYINKMGLTIEDHFGVRVGGRNPVIMRWVPGNVQEPHADKQLNDGRPNNFPNYDLNSLFYYNDDFDGGEIYFPQYGIEIKPKPGLAVFFPGDINYLHGVRVVRSGERFTTPAFFTITSLAR